MSALIKKPRVPVGGQRAGSGGSALKRRKIRVALAFDHPFAVVGFRLAG
jgi:hypothetical protein